MPSVTHDARSFLIDGRRIWLVAGRIPYARLPREAWSERIHAAKLAGFNTIETPVCWARHEPRPGRFEFQGDNDLRYFVDLVGKAGMYCILGIGPYTGNGWDLGGLPSWLPDMPSMRLRTTGGPFLEACSRYITALADQIRGWQVTAPGSGGPIVMVQCENDWTCGEETLAATYLGELTRYIRESGITVPIVNSNQLWAGAEGQIDGWTDVAGSIEQLRQLSVVRPEQPRFVVDLLGNPPDTWGRASHQAPPPWAALRRAAEVLAAGGQFTVQSLCAGVNLGFSGGRSARDNASFVTAASDPHALLSETGQPGPAFMAVRRVATFASRFGRVFANLDPYYRPVSLCPQTEESLLSPEAGKKTRGLSTRAGVSVMHCVGSQGSAVFLFGDESQASGGTPQQVMLMLSDGWTLPVTLPHEGVAWCLFDVNVSNRCKMDYCNVSPFGATGHTLVCFGPEGTRAMLSINGSPVEIDVPEGRNADKPAIVEHEGLTIVIVSQHAVDKVYFKDETVYVGIGGLTPDGFVIPVPGTKSYTMIDPDGKHKSVPFETPKGRHAPDKHPPQAPSLGAWMYAGTEEYADGSSPRYARIAGPADLTSLGSPFGYGWYRIGLKMDSTRKLRISCPFSSDRLHLFHEGKAAGIIGVGPSAEKDAGLSFRKGSHSIVILAENLGRFYEGSNLGEKKGLYGPIYETTPIKLGPPKIVACKPIEALSFRTPLWQVRPGDSTLAERLTWTVHHKKKTPLIISIPSPPPSGILFLNDIPAAYMDSSGPTRIMLPPEQIEKGVATIQIALINSADPDREMQELADKGIDVREALTSLTDDAEVSFAKWEPPTPTMFSQPPKGKLPDRPVWWRCSFAGEKVPGLYLEITGLTKGQIYLNGKHVSRYWVSTADGEAVPPQTRYFIPGAWVAQGENVLTLFDEHGGSPAKCRLSL